MSALPAIRDVAVRLNGKPKQEAECTVRQAIARELTDDDGCDSLSAPLSLTRRTSRTKNRRSFRIRHPENRNSTDRRK
jgi:hypothetical protein